MWHNKLTNINNIANSIHEQSVTTNYNCVLLRMCDQSKTNPQSFNKGKG